MANVIIDNTHLTNIADAIREKAGTSDTYKPGEMAAAISAIEAGGGEVVDTGFKTARVETSGFDIAFYDKDENTVSYANQLSGDNAILTQIINNEDGSTYTIEAEGDYMKSITDPSGNVIDLVIYPESESYEYGTNPLIAYQNGLVNGLVAYTIGGGSSSAGGGDIPEEVYKISGDCMYMFNGGKWDWFIEQYGDKITTENITLAMNMFNGTNVEEIPFDLNFDPYECSVGHLFSNAAKLTTIPKLIGLKLTGANYIFSNCHNLRELSAESVEGIDWSSMDNLTSSYAGNRNSTFANCYSLRTFPMEFLNHGNPVAYNGYSIYSELFTNCYNLDEVINLPVMHRDAAWTSNAFSNTFENCYRVKNITFETTSATGAPTVAKWKNQKIDLRTVGHAPHGDSVAIIYITDYNSGITADKEIKDYDTYIALKDDPDCFSTNMTYSRYTRSSAVRTINSLPDTSAFLTANGGTNTIMFEEWAGANISGEEMTSLTDEEIAVAAAKGWTVSIG